MSARSAPAWRSHADLRHRRDVEDRGGRGARRPRGGGRRDLHARALERVRGGHRRRRGDRHGGGRGAAAGGLGRGRRLRPGRGRHLRAGRCDPHPGDVRRGGRRDGLPASEDRHGPGGLGRETGGVRERQRDGRPDLRPRGGRAEHLEPGHRGAGEHAGGERRGDPVRRNGGGRGAGARGPRPRPGAQGRLAAGGRDGDRRFGGVGFVGCGVVHGDRERRPGIGGRPARRRPRAGRDDSADRHAG